MPSIHPGYEYDIFISYRQNDNKYDGWVTEFVANLNKELEATFKEKITVYFDANPHDGLLETHSVDKSLESKLKCLIFLPILSRTYCDPKSFAWQHEFVAFVSKATSDSLGLNVKLRTGNVASRVLPIRIHDLEAEDIALVQQHLGHIRSIDFIYHTPGVNRSLRPWDDDVIKNTKQPFYRDQINKVANAIDEVIKGLKHVPASKEKSIPTPPAKPKSIPAERSRPSRPFRIPSYAKWTGVATLLAIAVWFGANAFTDARNETHAREVLIPAIQTLVSDNYSPPFVFPPVSAYKLALEASRYLPADSLLNRLWSAVSISPVIKTNPGGAKVYWKDYTTPDAEWTFAGTTPLEGVRIPKTYLRLKIEKPGYEDVQFAGAAIHTDSTGQAIIQLDSIGTIPSEMIRVPRRVASMYIVGLEHHQGPKVGPFLIDRYEVSNQAYKKFIDDGGYSNPAWWTHDITTNGEKVPWTNAMKLFVDQTGKPGPAAWETGSYPAGQENYPVSGVSWYEAEAYASYAGKKLPTVFHWSVVSGTFRAALIIPLSNLSGQATVECGKSQAMNTYGAVDMAGNVREWCHNSGSDPDQKYILGGAWNEPTYSFNDANTQSALDRSASNGFRCIKEGSGDSLNQKINGSVKMAFRDYRKEKPVDDRTFKIFLRQFEYDKTPLNAQVTNVADTGIWKVQKVVMDATYNKEKVIVYFFLPRNQPPPYQPVILFPGSGAISLTTLNANGEMRMVDFLVKTGRAFAIPVFKGTYERKDELHSDLPEESVFYKDHVITWVKDLSRTIDYIETRDDLSSDKIGYFGWSWGSYMGGIALAVEPRFKAAVLHVGGMVMDASYPEVDQLNFLPRVRTPVIMLNGKYDMFFPMETSQKTMFDLLGTPAEDKKQIIYEAGHVIPRLELIKESLAWYDKYLGPVKQ